MITQIITFGTIGALLSTTPLAATAGHAFTAFALDGAVPADHVDVNGPTVWTAVSGDTAQHSYTIGSANPDFGAYSLRWWEDNNDPCKFRLYKRHFNNSSIVRSPTRNFCDGSPGDEKWAERRGANEYITAIKVCRSDRKNSLKEKIKGIRLWGRTINKNTVTLSPQAGPHEDKHNNCAVWRNKVSCPAGHVATKMRVYYDTYVVSGFATDYGAAKGIALGCREVVRG